MHIVLKKTLNLYPIGDIAFVFNKRSRRKGKQILISEVNIYQDSRMDIKDEANYKYLLKFMKERNSDLLTDGYQFYTTFGQVIARISHPQFILEMELEKENNPEYYLEIKN